MLQIAQQTLAAADQAAANGNINDAEARRQAAWDLVNAARCPSCLPQTPQKGSYELQSTASEQSEKSKSFAASKDLYDAANDLDRNGFPGFANDARKTAAMLLNISLGLARVVTIIDLPLNILEAFAQKTVEFDESGTPQIVEASGIEIAFAVGTLAFVAVGAVTVGWQAAIGVGIIAGLGKTVEKGMVKHAAEKVAVEIAEKGVVGAEKEALEQTAKEAAEAEGKDITSAATDAVLKDGTSISIQENKNAYSSAASVQDRNGFTKAGRAAQKHGSRPGSSFPNISGKPLDYNEAGQKVVDSILNDTGSKAVLRENGRYGKFIDIIAENGQGLRYSESGDLIGFLEPK